MKGRILFSAAALICLTLSGFSFAAPPGPLYATPVYDPSSKSYYELVLIQTTRYSTRGAQDIDWTDAEELAEASTFKGVHGRLAVVKNIEVHNFLLTTFRPQWQTWIGLRYMCLSRRLQWTDGTIWKSGMFAAWDEDWDESGYPDGCGGSAGPTVPMSHKNMPVAYSQPVRGFRWFATGWAKHFYSYFVEYPTGKP